MTHAPLRSTGQAGPANTVSVHGLPIAAASRRARAWIKLYEGFGFYAFVAGFVAFCLAPFVWTFLTSLKGPTTIYEVPIRYLPTPPDLINYWEIFGLDRFRWALLNSTIVASSATAISLVIGSLCAYAIARLNFPFKNLLLALVLAIAMFPGIAIIGPLFRQFNAWGLTNNYLALILPNVTFTLPICIWVLTAFFSELPSDLEESARVDGCTRLQSLRHVVLPLALPGLIGTAVFAFLWAWNEFLFAVVLTAGPEAAPLTIRMSQFFSQYGRDWNGIMALNVVASIPLLVAFVWLQRWVVEGMTAGAVK